MTVADGPAADVLGSLRLHAHDAVPLYLQLKHQLAYLITTQRLPGGSRLPPVRSLASDLDVNQHTVGQAYRELQQDGLIESFPGRGSFVRQFDDHGAARSARLERLSTLLRDARRRALALGFRDAEVAQHLASLVHHEQEVCRVAFVDRFPHIAGKYAAALARDLGDVLRATPLTVADVEGGTRAARAVLDEVHFLFAFARTVPALEQWLAREGGHHEVITIVSEVVPDTVATLIALPSGTRAALLTEERFVHAALDLLGRHGGIDPAHVVAFTPDGLDAFVAATQTVDVAFYSFGVAAALEGRTLGAPLHELRFDVSPDSIAKIRALLG
jgi:GntR family transcriptional regulator